MKLKYNIISNYISQVYVMLVGILMLPQYIKYMGAEAYGLVGFFTMLQTWFNMLDVGLTPTIARETARFRGGAIDAFNYRCLVWTLERLFHVIAICGGCALLLNANYIAHDWLHTKQLPGNEVLTAMRLMSVIVAMRWMSGLYRGVVSGSEKLIWLGMFTSANATIRFIGVLPVLIFVGTTPTIFFSFQFFIATLELAWMRFYAKSLLPTIPDNKRLNASWDCLKPVYKFSLTIAFTSSVWVLVTQMDKLVLSGILPLSEYGYFTLAVLVANGVMVISGPVSGAIMPRMAKLEAEDNHLELIKIYRQATQLVVVIAGSASITVTFFAEQLLFAWTGDNILAQHAAPVLILYAIGNGFLSVTAFAYYLQYAKGNLRLHLINNAMFVLILVPLIIWAATKYGGIGAGYVWLAMNVLSFIAWMPIIHHKFAPGLNRKWYIEDVAIILLATLATGYGMKTVMPHLNDRWPQLAVCIISGLLIMTAGALTSSGFWAKARLRI